MQLGLRYDGGSVPFEEDLLVPSDDDRMELLGMMPDASDFFSHLFRLLWLSLNFARRVPETEAATVVKARALILYTMGAMIFYHGNELVSSCLLSLVADITFPTSYNWNAALLAHLYEGLDKANRCISRSLTGFYLVIKVYFFDHFPYLVPTLIDHSPPFLHMMLWYKDNHSCTRMLSDLAWRSNVDALVLNDFRTRPYLRSNAALTPGAQEAFQASRRHRILEDPHVKKCYLGERLFWQLTGSLLVPLSPLSGPSNWRSVPEWELTAALEGFDASAFIDLKREYSSWCEQYGIGLILQSGYAPGDGTHFAGGGLLVPHFCRKDTDAYLPDDD
ncbi:uncharacterized protein LOC131221902 [Magnolia sinica]|uniref:uncharacterized protein LOC131221902 n=1 Tax=Magnolia sinica TaxID=86752 RepID=UPI002657FBE8|nr:uncharacterized protein LOC131221902 [Magnolia sinica]